MCIILIVLAIGNSLFGAPCGLTTNQPVYAEKITDCLKTIPIQSNTMSPGLLQGYIDILIEYVGSSSIFYLYMEGQAGGYPSYDTLQDLKDLRANISSSSNYFAVCERIHVILSRLKDCRIGAGYPYLGNFVYFLPFGLTTANQYNSDNVTHLELVATSYSQYILNSTNTNTDNPDRSNEKLNALLTDALVNYFAGTPPTFIVEEIDFTSGNGSAYLPASHALSYYALKENDYMRDPHGSYNFIAKGYFSSFNAAYMMHPTEPGKYNQHIWLKGRNLSSATPDVRVEIDVPFWGLYRGPQDATWDTLSPRATSSSSSSFSSFSNKNSKKPLRRLHPSEDQEIPRLARNADKPKPYVSPLVKPAFEKMMNRRHTTSHPLSNAYVKFEELWNYINYPEEGDDFVLCRVLADRQNKIGYLLFLEGYDFDDVTKVDVFYDGLGKAFRKMVDQGVENLIVDMRGHEGGYVSVYEAVFDFLFHNAIYPRSTEQDVIKSSANQEVIKFFQKYPAKMGLSFSEWEPFLPYYDQETVTKIHTDRSRYPPKSFTSDHSTRVFCEGCIPSQLSQAYGGYSPFDAQHLYLLTDGDCFGGCAIMTLQAVELNLARVLGYGWNPAFEEKLSTYVPGCCTGTYWGSDVLDYLKNGLDEDGSINATNFPKPWAWSDSRLHFTFTHFEDFSRNPDHLGQSLLFSNATVHEVLPYKVNADIPTIANIEDIAAKIIDLYVSHGYCFANEVRPDPACQTPERNALHQRYGRPCDTVNGRVSWSTSKCSFAYCETGYYYNGTLADFGGDCIPIPEGISAVGAPQSKAAKEKFPGWGSALIVIAVILAVIAAALIGYLVVTYRKEKLSSVPSNQQQSRNYREEQRNGGGNAPSSFGDAPKSGSADDEEEEG